MEQPRKPTLPANLAEQLMSPAGATAVPAHVTIQLAGGVLVTVVVGAPPRGSDSTAATRDV